MTTTHRFIAPWTLIALAVAFTILPASPVHAQAGTWQSLAPLPNASYGLGAEFVNGQLYAISGFATTRLAAFDPMAGTWTTKAAMTSPLRQYFGHAAIGNKIYVVGGDTGGSGPLASALVYDTVANSWSSLPSMPGGARYSLVAGAIGGKVYAVGGFNGSSYLGTNECYDPATNLWTAVAPLPVPRAVNSSAVINGKLYVCGGGNASGEVRTLSIYDPATNTWTTGADMAFARGAGGAAVDGRIYIPGGSPAPETSVAVYDLQSNTWSTETNMPTGRHDLGVAADPVARKVFAVGGFGGGTKAALEVLSFPSAPIVVTGNATGVTGTAATLNGTVNPNNVMTTVFFEYGETTSYGSSTPNQSFSGSSVANVQAGLTSLAPNKLYHYRLAATNAGGTTRGEDATFTTAANLPTATTGGASNVTNSGATLSGTVNPNGIAATAVFQYGLTASYGFSADANPAPGSGNSPVAISANLSGLQSNQTYHFRVTATNQAGSSSGEDGTFTTAATPPTVTTGGSTNVNATSATMGGTVNPNGATTTAAFEYGLTVSYGSTVNATPAPGSGSAPVDVSATAGGLTPNRTYHYRLTGMNPGGSVAGQDFTFTTPAILPVAVTESESNLTPTGAMLHGTVNPNGAATTARFVFRRVGGSEQQTTAVNLGNGTSDIPLEATLTGLSPFTDYEYRIEASNTAGTEVGRFELFKTAITALAAAEDTWFVGQTAIEIAALENDAGDGLQIVGLLDQPGATPFDPARVLVVASENQLISFTPTTNQTVNLADPRERFRYRVQDLAATEAQAEVSVYYFLGLRGTYSGTFPVPGAPIRVVTVRMELNFAGQATGRFDWEGEQYPFKVQTDSRGRLNVVKNKKNGDGQLALDLQMLPVPPDNHVYFGTFADQSTAKPGTGGVALQFLRVDGAAEPARGLQVAFIDPGDIIGGAPLNGTTSTILPQGVGFVRINVLKKAQARFVTKMPDFSAFSAGKKLVAADPTTPQGRYFLQQAAKEGKRKVGQVEGTVFTGRESGDGGDVDRVVSLLDWNRPAVVSGSALFAGGFHINALLEGSFYLHPPGTKVPAGFMADQNANADVRLAGGGLAGPIVFPAFMDESKGSVGQGADSVALGLGFKMKFKFAQGFFSGSFKPPGSDEIVKFQGGISSKEKRCRGVFFSPGLNQSGSATGRIEITPRAAP